MDNLFDESASVPFFGTEEQLRKLSDIVSHTIKAVTKSTNPREMVLETWLVLDYAVRDLVVSAYGLYEFCQEDFDLRYELLPNSFRALLKFLQDTYSYYSKFPQEPISINHYPPYIHSNYSFLKYLADNHGDLCENLKEIEMKYFAEQHPEYAVQIEQGQKFYFEPLKKNPCCVPSDWLDVVCRLDRHWYRRAEKLNNARNKAVHLSDASGIAKVFGIKGKRAVILVRQECLKLLKKAAWRCPRRR